MPTIRELMADEIAGGDTLGNVVSRWTSQGYTADDFDLDVKSARRELERRRKQKLAGEPVGLPGEATETTAPTVPEMPSTEWNPTAKLQGVAEGFMEGLEDMVYPRRKDVGRSKIASRAKPGARDGVAGAAKEELERRRKLIQEKPAIERLGEDVGNVFSAIPAMVSQTVGRDVVPAGENPEDVARRAGQVFGESLPRGVVGSTLATLDSPIEYAMAEPFSAAMDFMPVVGAAGKGVKAAAYASKVKPLVPVVSAVSKVPGIALDVAGSLVGEGVDKGVRVAAAAADKLGLDKTSEWLGAGSATTRAKRFFGDPASHPERQVQALTRDLLDEPRRVQSSIERRGEGLQATRTPDPNVYPDTPVDLSPERTFSTRVETPGLVEKQAARETLVRNIDTNERAVKATQSLLDAKLARPQTKARAKEVASLDTQLKRQTLDLEQQRQHLADLDLQIERSPSEQVTGLTPGDQGLGTQITRLQTKRMELDAERKMSFEGAERERLGREIEDIDRKLKTLEAEEMRATAAADKRFQAGKAEVGNPIVADIAREYQTARSGMYGNTRDLQLGDVDFEARVAEELGSVLHNDLTHRELLRDELFRKEFQKRSNLSDRQMQTLLRETVDDSRIRLSPEYQRAFQDTLNIMPVDHKLRKRVVAATISQMAEEAAKASKKRLLDAEADRVVPPAFTPRAVATPVTAAEQVGSAAARGQVGVQALRHDVNPSSLADTLDAWLERHPELDKSQVSRVREEQTRLRSFRQLDMDLVGSDHWVDPLLHGALTSEAQARKMIALQSGVGYAMRQMKSNLTARNLKSSMTNMISNSLMQAIRRGDLTGGVWDMVQASRNRKANPEKWAALDRTGLFDSSLLKEELNLDKPMWFNKIQEDFYQKGDVWFKRGEAHRAYDELTEAIGDLKPGETITVAVAPGRDIILVRTPGGMARVDKSLVRMDKGRTFAETQNLPYGKQPARLVTDRELADITARAAAHRANALFFDYGDVPGLAKLGRAQPAVGILSPFYSYTAKAVDIPGLKKGLGSQIVSGSQGWFDSTSPKILAKQAQNMLVEGARRSAMLHALKQSLLDRENEELSRVIQFMPSDIRPAFISGLSNPSHLAVDTLGNWNVLSPSLSLLRLLQPVDTELGDKAPSRMGWDPHKVRLMRLAETGHLGGASDALGLIGMGGSAITDLLAAADESERTGKDFLGGQLFRGFLPAMVGGTAATGVDIGLGAIIPDSAFTSRMSGVSAKDPQVQEDFVRWAMRKSTGLGWKALGIYDERGFDALGRKWKESLDLKGQKARYEKALGLARAAGDRAAMADAWKKINRVKQLDRIVDNEMEIWRREWKDTANRVFAEDKQRLQRD